VVKVGGSLFPNKAIKLIKHLKNTNSLIILGGGEFANYIRKIDDEIAISDDIAHEVAIDSMDIIAKIVDDKLNFTKLAYSLDEAKSISDDGFIPILITSHILKEEDPFKHSWEVTSDSIACYFSHILKAKLLIATNVKGIYTRNPKHQDSIFIERISANKLLNLNESSVDLMLPKLLLEFGADCFVVNGNYPERVLTLINKNPKEVLKEINSYNNYDFQFTYIKGGK
jgi:aspartokinase-like uncharacterized kinase